MREMTDEQLVREYLTNQDELVLEQLVQRHLPSVYGFVRNYTGNAEVAADITQEAFVKAWKNLKRFDQTKNFRTWLFTIAKRTAIDWLKKKQALPFSALENEGVPSFAELIKDDAASLFDQLVSKESSKELGLAMAQLPSHYSSVIKLRAGNDLTFDQIACRLKEPLNTVKSRYRRGIVLLKKLLTE